MRRFTQYPMLMLTLCTAATLMFVHSAIAQQRQALQARVAAPEDAKLIGRMPASQQLRLAVSLPLRNQEQLNLLLQQLEDPTSPKYRQYLSVEQFTEQFGPTAEDYQRVIDLAKSHGFTVTNTSKNRTLVNVTGTSANVEEAFHVKMQLYQHPTENRTYYAPDVTPTVETGFPVLSVSGLTNRVLPHSMLVQASTTGGVHSDATGSGEGGQFLGSDIRAAYYGTGPLNGSGQAIALAELGQWNMADVQAYFSAVGQPLNVPIVTELLGGTSGECDNCNDGEEVIDIQQIISMAPGASTLIVYEDTSGNADIDIFNAYANDNLSKEMSFSFGIGDGNAAADEQAFQQFHAQGQNFFVASGDGGAFPGTGGWPGFSQNVTDVGGTDLTTATPGGAWSAEMGWVGSGGGWCDTTISGGPCDQSPYGAIPSYQSSPSTMLSAITADGGTSLYRNVPDVSAEANTDNFFCSGGSCKTGIGGTSLAAPRWAGFIALANQQASANGETVGFLNPLIYALGQTSNYDTAFHDITSGSDANSSSNGLFTAATGYDLVSGWGTPSGQGFIDALAPTSTTNPYFALSAMPGTLNLTAGGAPGTATISLTPGNGFSGTVALSANVLGAPAGVTADISPATITGTGTATLTVSTTSATPAGTLEVAVTGTSASGIQTQAAYVTLGLPDFTLSASPNNIFINQGQTVTSTVAVVPQNGFTGTVDLSLGGLPIGVTGTLAPISTATTSTLTLTASTTAATSNGAYLALNGTSGNTAPPSPPYTFLSVSAATGTGGAGTPVDLSSAFNMPGIYGDGVTFPSTSGLAGGSSAYSSNLLTPNRILNGIQFNFGAANTTNCGASGQPACINDTVETAAQTIALPAGQFTKLELLASAVDGPVLSQTFTVTYTDNTTSAFTQNFSDWCNCSSGAGEQPGESIAVAMPYRDTDTGAEQSIAFNVYAYTFILNSGKTVQSITLPATPSQGVVVVLAATLTTQSVGTQVDLSSEYNLAGLFDNGVTFPLTAGMDGGPNGGGDGCTLSSGCSDAYSVQQLGLSATTPPTLYAQNLVFDFGPVNTVDCTTACIPDMININPGATVSLPANQQLAYTTLTLLGTAVQGSHTGTVTVNYASGAPDVFNQTFDDWCGYSGIVGNEAIAVGGFSRINSDGTLSTGVGCNLYSYTYTLDPTRAVQSIALANTDGTNYSLVLALTLSGNTASSPMPSFTLTPAATSLSVTQGSSGTDNIAITGINGFTGSVTLAPSGLPSGVTATFTTNPATGSSVLTLTASGTATTGASTITITGTSGSTTASTTIALTVVAKPTPVAQTITWAAIPPQTAHTTLALTATASSGLPVTYTSTTPSICTISGSDASLIAHGNCTINASQAGNAQYSAAPVVSQTFIVRRANQTIAWATIPSQTAGTTLTLTATTSSGLPVAYISLTPFVCTVSGNSASLRTDGDCIIAAYQAGDVEYAPAPPAWQTFFVQKLSRPW